MKIEAILGNKDEPVAKARSAVWSMNLTPACKKSKSRCLSVKGDIFFSLHFPRGSKFRSSIILN